MADARELLGVLERKALVREALEECLGRVRLLMEIRDDLVRATEYAMLGDRQRSRAILGMLEKYAYPLVDVTYGREVGEFVRRAGKDELARLAVEMVLDCIAEHLKKRR